MFQGYNLKTSFNQPEVTDSLGNSKIFSDKILLNKSLVLCSVKHYPSTLLKGKLKHFQSILYRYNVGNM